MLRRQCISGRLRSGLFGGGDDVTDWTFATVYEAIAERVPDRACQVQGDRVVTWRQFDRRANALAADMLEAGLGFQSKVAVYLYSCPEYLETYVAAFKGGFVPANTNYRYGPEEVFYLFDNADAEAVVFHAAFATLLEGIRPRLPQVRRWYCVADGTAPVPSWAVDHAEIVGEGADRVRAPWNRSGDDLLLLYTGGTTGMPKGVMWRQDDLFNVLGAGGNPVLGIPPAASLAELLERIDPTGPGLVVLPACPLMHGTGQFSSFLALNSGGTIAILASRQFDAGELWDEVARMRVNAVIIVGQAFAAPMLAELDAHSGQRDLSSLFVITSSGVMWSQENKDGLLRHLPQAILFDSLGSSEAVGLGSSVSSAAAAERTAKFNLGEDCAVFTEDGRRVAPGSGEAGQVGISGFIPVGYYKDERKTAETFRTFEGRPWSVPGDWAEVASDGTVHLLGRGSACINTGGEKVFPEEVEEVLRTHPAVADVVCVGVPDERFGETICALVETTPGAGAVDQPTLAGHVKATLAAYKAPRHVVVLDGIERGPNGKVDYKRLKAIAVERVGPTA
jgi:acyl-CoA synthetase (AMP-forming)/AMP-acid ligase II